MSTFILQPIVAGPAVAALDGVDTVGNAIRSVSSSTPNTTGWASGDVWIDTLDGATENVVRVWSGTAFVPARSVDAPLLVDLFTGSDGGALSNWVTGTNPATGTGGGATIQGNMARFQTSTTGGFSADSRISRRANITNPTDANISFSFKHDSTTSEPRVWIRADNGMIVNNGYYMRLRKGTWAISKTVSFSPSALSGDIAFGYSLGTLYSARFRVVGTTVQGKVWVAADAEPSAWGYTTTDSSVTAAGAVGFEVVNGGSTGANANFFVDNVTIEES